MDYQALRDMLFGGRNKESEGGLGCYQDIIPSEPGSAISEFKDMEADDLADLAATLEENPEQDREQLMMFIYAHYSVFIKVKVPRPLKNLNTAIRSLEDLVDTTRSNDGRREVLLHDLVVMLAKRAECTRDLSHLDTAVFRAQEMLANTDLLHQERYSRWDGVVRLLRMYARFTGDSTLLNDMTETAKTLVSQSAAMMAEYLGPTDGQALALGLLGGGSSTDRKSKIQTMKEAVAVLSNDSLQRRIFLDTAGDLAHTEAMLGGTAPASVEEGIILNQMAVTLYNDLGDPFQDRKPKRLLALAWLLMTRFNQSSRDIEDLNRAIRCYEQLLIEDTDPDPNHIYLRGLHDTLLMRIKAGGRLADGERAVRIVERLLRKYPSHTERPAWLNLLSVDLCELFRRTADKISLADSMKALNRILSISMEVLAYLRATNEQAHSAHLTWDWLNEISSHLCLRYQYNDDIKDLDFSIRIGEEAVQPRYRLEQANLAPKYLFNLANKFERRYERLGNPEDLNRLIALVEDALGQIDIHEQGTEYVDYTFKPYILDLLCRGLLKRYKATGDDDVFQEVVRRWKQAVAMCPDDGDHKDILLNNLSSTYEIRFRNTGNLNDIDEAIRLQEQAIKLLDKAPGGQERVPLYLFGIACLLAERYRSDPTRFAEDIRTAIEYAESIRGRLPKGQFEEGKLSYVLGGFYYQRWETTPTPSDIEKAISYGREAVTASSGDHGSVETAQHKLELARYLSDWRRPGENIEDLIAAADLCKEAMNITGAPPSTRIQCAIIAANCFHQLGQGQELADIGEQAIHLLPLLSSRALKQRDQQRLLKQFGNLTRRAVSASLVMGRDPSHCLELLEFGRGIINGLRFDSRTTDVARLVREHPALAKRFLSLRDALDGRIENAQPPGLAAEGARGALSLQPEVLQKHKLTKDFDDIVKEIRNTLGFNAFMQAPRANELRMVANSQKEAVVVIVVGIRSCDAILIQNRSIRRLHLPDLHEEDIERNVYEMRLIRLHQGRKKLAVILAWLWKTLVGPVLEELGFTTTPSGDELWPRVWWAPTGPLTQLPLHAAGNRSVSSLDRVVSSYSSSVKALMFTQRAQRAKTTTKPKIVLASMTLTPGASALEYADLEVDALAKLLPRDSVIQMLRGPTKANLSPHLGTCSVFHFAGHGMSHPEDPSKSLLLLKDWQTNPFSVTDLMELNLSNPWLAYLSACSTGENQDDKLYDESIHLMGACHSAGFQHVIGSLWEVSDMYSVEVAKSVYGDLQDGLGATADGKGNVALALHKAIRKLRTQTAALGGRRDIDEGGSTLFAEDSDILVAKDDEGFVSSGVHRGDRGGEVVRVGNTNMGDPLTWAAYVHVGL